MTLKLQKPTNLGGSIRSYYCSHSMDIDSGTIHQHTQLHLTKGMDPGHLL